MLELSTVLFTALKLFACVAAFLLACYFYVNMNPKILIRTLYRFSLYKFNIKKKTIKGKLSPSYCFLERGTRSPEKPSILLVHGYSSSKYDYLSLITFMSRDYHVIALDLPGHGETPLMENQELNIMFFVHAVNDFVKSIGLNKQKFHLFGTSMGGHVAGLYATEYPEHLKSLILVCPHGIYFEKQQQMIDEAINNQNFVLLPQTLDEIKHMFDMVMHRRPKIRDIFMCGILQIRLEKDLFYRKLGEALAAADSHNLLEKNLHKINTPVLLIWGKEDQILHVECVETIQAKLPSPPKQIVLLDQVGHGVPIERPRKCNFILQDFIMSL